MSSRLIRRKTANDRWGKIMARAGQYHRGGGARTCPLRQLQKTPWVQRAYRRRPHAGTYIEASTTKRPTIKQTTALVTSEAHGQPSAQDSSHRVCMWQPPLL